MLKKFLQFLYAQDGSPAGSTETDTQAADTPPADTAPPEPKLPKFGSQLSPEIREKHKKELGEYADKSLNEVWGDLIETRGKLSRAIVIPDPKDKDQEKFKAEAKAFHERMGIPETPDGYELKADAKILDKNFLSGFRKDAFEMGLTKTQAQKSLAKYEALAKQGMENIKATRKTAEDNLAPALRKALNNDDAEVEKNINLAKKHLVRYGDKRVLNQMADSTLMYNPEFILKAAEIERLLADTKFVDGDGPNRSPVGAEKRGVFGKNYSKEFKDTHGGKA